MAPAVILKIRGQKLSLSVYTRHYPPCTETEIHYRRCKCPKWIQGVLDPDKPPVRQSAGTRSWERAEQECRRLERQYEETKNSGKPLPERITIEKAVQQFLKAKVSEGLRDATVSKLRLLLEKYMLAWTKQNGLDLLDEINDSNLEHFRSTWVGGGLTRKKKQESLIAFFNYCVRKKWISANPAKLLGRIKAAEKPTDYFPADEFARIIDATYIYNPKAWNTEPRNQATRVRALILLMRWSGLAISDAVSLERTRLTDKNEIFLRRAKTGQPVYVPIPPDVADALRNIPPGPATNPRYFFWSGNGKLKSAVADWQRALRRVFDLADISHADETPKRCHPHMFRDTFAVECLLAGVPLEQVSILLGHGSIKITEKHYAPWVKARQEQLTASVRKSWDIQQGTKKNAASAR
jgi:integrase/recombinase XerD